MERENKWKRFRQSLEEFKKTLIPLAEAILLLLLLAKAVGADIRHDPPVLDKQTQGQQKKNDDPPPEPQPQSEDRRKGRQVYRLL